MRFYRSTLKVVQNIKDSSFFFLIERILVHYLKKKKKKKYIFNLGIIIFESGCC